MDDNQAVLKAKLLENFRENTSNGDEASETIAAENSEGLNDMNMMSAISAAENGDQALCSVAGEGTCNALDFDTALARYRDAARRECEYREIYNSAESAATDLSDPVLAQVEDAWNKALRKQAEAWRALAASEVSTLTELQEKIAVVRVDSMLDGDAGEGVPLIDSIASDIARLRGVTADLGRATWDRALSAFSEAKDSSDRHSEETYTPLSDELNRIAPRPEFSFDVEIRNGRRAEYTLWPCKLDEYDSHPNSEVREKAARIRDAWLAHTAVSKSLGIDTAGEEADRLGDIQSEKQSALVLVPSPDFAALLYKLEMLWGEPARDNDEYSPSWCAEWVNSVMADAQRLLSA